MAAQLGRVCGRISRWGALSQRRLRATRKQTCGGSCPSTPRFPPGGGRCRPPRSFLCSPTARDSQSAPLLAGLVGEAACFPGSGVVSGLSLAWWPWPWPGPAAAVVSAVLGGCGGCLSARAAAARARQAWLRCVQKRLPVRWAGAGQTELGFPREPGPGGAGPAPPSDQEAPAEAVRPALTQATDGRAQPGSSPSGRTAGSPAECRVTAGRLPLQPLLHPRY